MFFPTSSSVLTTQSFPAVFKPSHQQGPRPRVGAIFLEALQDYKILYEIYKTIKKMVKVFVFYLYICKASRLEGIPLLVSVFFQRRDCVLAIWVQGAWSGSKENTGCSRLWWLPGFWHCRAVEVSGIFARHGAGAVQSQVQLSTSDRISARLNKRAPVDPNSVVGIFLFGA